MSARTVALRAGPAFTQTSPPTIIDGPANKVTGVAVTGVDVAVESCGAVTAVSLSPETGERVSPMPTFALGVDMDDRSSSGEPHTAAIAAAPIASITARDVRVSGVINLPSALMDRRVRVTSLRLQVSWSRVKGALETAILKGGPNIQMEGAGMIISTTTVIEGRPVREYLGVVAGETVMGANVFKDIGATFRNITGGRAEGYEKELRKGRDMAIQEMAEQAESMGADAVIGVDLDYETVNTGMLMITASGTAVRLGASG
jgi:uncharacterized protein YbjQ (UPF0145 family)